MNGPNGGQLFLITMQYFQSEHLRRSRGRIQYMRLV